MIFKTVLMSSLFFVPLIFINSGLVSSATTLFILYLLSGLGMAGIGMGIMHDAIHGSYSRNKRVNKILGYSMNLIGANANVWKIQHNLLHHNYTNIDAADEDIHTPFFLRFSPHAKKNFLHRFQFLYIWFFYGVSTLSWITIKDFARTVKYRKMGFIKTGPDFRKELLKVLAWKLLYYTYAIVLPLIIVPLPPVVILLAFASMHFLTGLITSIIFQTAHVMPNTEFPLPDENGLIANDWAFHQLATTSNFSPKSRLFSWFIGGLNFQVEHHLLPNICHVHYRNLSPIVKKTAEEFGIPYNIKKTFTGAVLDHIRMLKKLGTMELSPEVRKIR